MTALDTIRASVEPELEAYENFIERQFTADGELLSEMLHYALTSRGKGIRPLLVILSAALNASVKGAASGRRTRLAAMLVEMIHVASLIHDDVIDESDTRRAEHRSMPAGNRTRRSFWATTSWHGIWPSDCRAANSTW